MSYDYRRTTTTTRNPRGRYIPPPPPSRSGNHSLLGYWVPVVVTGTLAIGGLAAWIWSERSQHDDDDYPHDKPPRPPTGQGAPYPPTQQQQQQYNAGGPGGPGGPGGGLSWSGPPPSQSAGPQGGPPPVGGESASYYQQESSSQSYTASQSRSAGGSQQQDDGTWYGRVSGMVKRTPSPQQFFDSASKQVSAGVAAAGAALGSIMEGGSDEEITSKVDRRDTRRSGSDKRDAGRREDREREGFSDHERWSEEADERVKIGGVVDAESERRAKSAKEGKGRKRKSVAVVVSAEAEHEEDEGAGYRVEHASILSHLPTPRQGDTNNLDVFVLIYAPGLTSLPNPAAPIDPTNTATSNIDSTFSTPAVTPGSELQSLSPRITPSSPSQQPSKQFSALYNQALTLVSSPSQILPFTTKEGYVHILRHLSPQMVYISDSLAGDEGEGIAQLNGWVGHTILVAGDEGHGGLADTETETETEAEDGRKTKRERRERWYDRSSLVGLGKGVEVVDAGRVGDDWSRRLGGRE